MSLINDALKRAKQSQQQQQQETAPTAPPLPPVEVARGGPSWLFPVAVILLVAVACFFIAFAFFITRKPVARITPAPPSAPPAAAPALPKIPPAATVQAATVTPKPSPPSLKVQGIFFNNAQWQAIVNGQSVFVGDRVNGFRVKLISKDNVSFVAPDGAEKTMTLGE